jgi:hypothetical protein
MTWTPPLDVDDLAHVAELIAKDGAAHIDVTEGCEPVTSWRIPPRVDELRSRLDASLAFDEKTLTWISVVPSADTGPDEVIQTASVTRLCEALDAAITRRAERIGRSVRNALAVLAQFWDGIYVVGWDGEECWCQRAGGTGEIMRAMSPEQLNGIMSAAYRTGLDYPPLRSAGLEGGPRPGRTPARDVPVIRPGAAARKRYGSRMGRRRGAVHIYRQIRQAADEELTGLRDLMARVKDFEEYVGTDLLTGLCELDEALAREQDRRASGGVLTPATLRTRVRRRVPAS